MSVIPFSLRAAAASGLAEFFRAARRPMPALALSALAGIWLAYSCFIVGALAAIFLIAGLAARALGSEETRRFWRLAAAGFAAGFALAAIDFAAREREGAPYSSEEGLAGEFVCRIGAPIGRTRSLFYAEEFSAAGGSARIRRCPVRLIWAGAPPEEGETWRFRGSAYFGASRRSPLPMLYARAAAEGAVRLARSGERPSLRTRIEGWRRNAAARASIGIEDWGAIPHLNQAMLLGARGEMPPDMRRAFADSGTIHIFAISGLHIMMVAGAMVLAAAALGVPRIGWALLLAPLLVLYTAVTGARPSAVRACIMAIVFFAADFLGRRPDGVSVLSATALAVHLCEPSLIFDAGCRLSFAVMAGVVFLCQPIGLLLRRAARIEALQRREAAFELAGARWKARLARLAGGALWWLAGSLAVSVSAWLAAVPLTASLFGRMTPGSIAANLAIVPSAFFVVAGGLLGMASSFVCRFAAECFNSGAGAFTWLMIKTAEATSACPLGSFKVARWEPWEAWLWYAALVVAAAWLHFACSRQAEGLDG